jgi:hypothetical protein
MTVFGLFAALCTIGEDLAWSTICPAHCRHLSIRSPIFEADFKAPSLTEFVDVEKREQLGD